MVCPDGDWDWIVAGESGNEVAAEPGAVFESESPCGLSIGRAPVGITIGRGRRIVENSMRILFRNLDWRLQLVLEDED